jgi:hypothetical protein
MNKNQLIDALGQLDDSVYEGIDMLNALPGEKAIGTGNGRRGRKVFLLAAVAVLLIGGAAVAAPPLLRGGTLKLEKETVDGKDYNSFRYETGEASRVPLSEITGSVLESMKEIPERIKNFNIVDSSVPSCIVKHFDSLSEALSYIGYSKLVFPEMNYPYSEIHTEAHGVSAQHPKVNAPDEEYVLGSLYLSTTQYDSFSGLSFQNLIHIYTEANPFDSTSLLLVNYPTETSYVTEEQAVNGRVFSIIKEQNTSEDPGWQLSTEVLWQENGVIYMFHVTYYEDKAAEADRLVEEWMKSFP